MSGASGVRAVTGARMLQQLLITVGAAAHDDAAIAWPNFRVLNSAVVLSSDSSWSFASPPSRGSEDQLRGWLIIAKGLA